MKKKLKLQKSFITKVLTVPILTALMVCPTITGALGDTEIVALASNNSEVRVSVTTLENTGVNLNDVMLDEVYLNTPTDKTLVSNKTAEQRKEDLINSMDILFGTRIVGGTKVGPLQSVHQKDFANFIEQDQMLIPNLQITLQWLKLSQHQK